MRQGERRTGTVNMARKKRPKRSWLKTLLIYIFVPLIVWFLAFVTWLYWDDITRMFSKDSDKESKVPDATRKLEKAGKNTEPTKRSQEKILDDDRKKLEDVLKQRQ
jgi:cytoskeletal protein RodZ